MGAVGKRGRTAALWLLAAAIVGGGASSEGKRVPCAGRYVLRKTTGGLLPALAAANGGAIVLDASGAILDPSCGSAAVRTHGTSMSAAWATCGVHARVRLQAKPTADCSLLRGVVRARGERPSRFRAATSICGDGITDLGRGERCDDGNFLDDDTCDATCGRCGDAAALTSTWAAIESAVIARYGCATCHGATPTASLDLRPPGAYDAIVGVPVRDLSGVFQVHPGDRATSFVWLKLAEGALGGDYVAVVPGAGMPIGGKATPAQVEAVGRWIDAGAPRDGIVAGTEALFAGCGSGS